MKITFLQENNMMNAKTPILKEMCLFALGFYSNCILVCYFSVTFFHASREVIYYFLV